MLLPAVTISCMFSFVRKLYKDLIPLRFGWFLGWFFFLISPCFPPDALVSQFITVPLSEPKLAKTSLFPSWWMTLLLNRSLTSLVVGNVLHLSWRGPARIVHSGVISIQFKKRGSVDSLGENGGFIPFWWKGISQNQSSSVNICSAVAVWTRPTYICKNNLYSSHWRGNKDFYFF